MIGIIGGGQLARMIALEARRMGYRTAVLDPDAHGPAAQVTDRHIEGEMSDVAAARALAECCDVLTIDSEHVPADLLQQLEPLTEVRPGAAVLRTVQDRLEQRRFLEAHGLPQPRYASVSCASDLAVAARTVGFPAVLKTRREGYDGKGQARVSSLAELSTAWDALDQRPSTLEAFVEFDKEISAILARGVDGEIGFYPVAENRHRRHILHTSHAPAAISPAVDSQARELGARVASELGHVGMLAVELFLTDQDEILVNEIAPRTHNSGHYTFGACATSQFEQHVRAICGLPLGDTSILRPAVMLNLLGDLWADGEPALGELLEVPGARLHLYGKRRASPGRKMGHVVVIDDEIDRAGAIAESIVSRFEATRPARDAVDSRDPGPIARSRSAPSARASSSP